MRSRSSTRPDAAAGFVLVSAIFLLVILAAVAAFMLHVSAGSQAASTLDLQGTRAYQAARTGVERGLWEVLRTGGSCPAGVQTMTLGGTLTGFVVSWTCSSTAFSENDVTAKNIYQISSTARYGATGGADFVERQLVAITEHQAP